MKKPLLVLICMFTLSACTTLPANKSNDLTNGKQVSAQEANFYATATYSGENQWSYVLTGEIPSPCHVLSHDVLVAESYPEQVTLQVSVTAPPADEVCIQVVEPVEKSGVYQASELASFKLRVSQD